MEIKNFFTYIALLLPILLQIITEISAAPALDDYGQYSIETYGQYDDDYYRIQRKRPVRRSYDDVDNLKRGYYYIDNGSITPVSSSDALTVRRPRAEERRRQDNFGNAIDTDNLPDGVKYKPVVRYRQIKTKHKKLFVPNLFG